MERRRHRTGPDSDEIPRRRRTGLVRDNQTDLDCGTGRPGERSRAVTHDSHRSRPAVFAVETALTRVVANPHQRSLARTLQDGRTVYQSDPAGSALIERMESNGRWTL